MARPSLRGASVACLIVWAAIWLMFIGLRLSPLDIRRMQGIGLLLLITFAGALLTPIMATGLAAAAWVRQPHVRPNQITLGCAIAALVGQVVLFLLSRWL